MTIQPLQVGEIKITIRATDICGVYVDQDFTVESLQCPCEGHNKGYCKWKNVDSISKELDCVCPKGCTGDR